MSDRTPVQRDWLMLLATFAGPAAVVGAAIWGWGGAVTEKLDDLHSALRVEIQARTDSSTALSNQVAAMQGDVTGLQASEVKIDHRLTGLEAAVYPALQPQSMRYHGRH